MPPDPSATRRDFLSAAAGAALAAGLAQPAAGAPDDDATRRHQPAGADLGSLFADIQGLAADRYEMSFLEDRFADLDAWRAGARAKVLELLLYRPEKVDPKPEVLERVDCGDYVREKLVFSTTPHFRVPAYLLVPKNLKGPAPGIVDLHSHGGMFLFGKEKVVDLAENHATMVEYHQRNYDGRPTASELAKRGYVVISIDALMFGERRVLLDADRKYGWDRSQYGPDDVKHLNLACRGKEPTLVKSLILAGLTWPGIVCWDDIRTLDYLASRPEVDASRLGCLGISMGGYRSLYLAALDERIRAACVTGFMSTVGPMIKSHVDTHSWVHFLPTLHRYLDWPDVASLAAPRALLVQQCAQDRLFPADGMKASVEKLAACYGKAGASSQFAGRFYDAPHMFTRPMQDEAFAWFDRHLKG
jgi:dienelactone hydrolase